MKQSISILIANFNNGHFFIDCYKSLINQTFQNWEAIVIDDCSTDNSVEIIKTLINSDNRFKFHQNKENIGYQKTILKGIDFSSTDLFARLDPDDALIEEAIEESIKIHNMYPEVGLVYSNFLICDEKLNPIKEHITKQINDISDDSYFGFKGEISHFASFKKSVYSKTTGIDAFIKRAEDKDIYMKMCEVAPVKHINKPLYFYRVHDRGVSTNTNGERAYFWHWVAVIKAAERRGINIEDLFVNEFIRRKIYDDTVEQNQKKINLLKQSKWLKLGYKLGLFKAYKYL